MGPIKHQGMPKKKFPSGASVPVEMWDDFQEWFGKHRDPKSYEKTFCEGTEAKSWIIECSYVAAGQIHAWLEGYKAGYSEGVLAVKTGEKT